VDYPWLRLYNAVLDDPKLQRLDPPIFKAWINLLCLAGQQEDRGTLPDLPEMAFRMRMTEPEMDETLHELIAAKLIDEEWGLYSIHNWTKYQYDSDTSTPRVRKLRDKKKETLHETLHVTPMKRKRNVIDTEEIQIREEKEKPLTGSKRTLPKDWSMSIEEESYAREHGLDPKTVAREFSEFYWSHGRAMADWHLTFLRWVREEEKRMKTRSNGNHKPQRISLAELARQQDRQDIIEVHGSVL
jgi:VCBS repeat-containing protein